MNEEKKDSLSIKDIFDQKLLDKIKENKISPKPRWHFLLKDYVIWIVGGLALVIGAGAVSVLTYLMTNNDLGIHQQVNKSWGELLLLTLPYFWLVFLGLFVFVIYYNIKHTKSGYKYPLWAVATASILVSIVLGECLFLLGVGEKIDGVLGRRAPLYEKFMNPQLDFWSNPEEGRLVGMPLEFSGDERFVLIDKNKKEWEIIPASSTVESYLAQIPLAQEMLEEENIPLPPVRLIGQQVSETEFKVDMIMPLMPGRAFFDRPGHRERFEDFRGNPGSHCLELSEDGLEENNLDKPNRGNQGKMKNNIPPCVVTDEGPMRSQPSPNN